jgi:hypothetical protein
MMETDVSMEDVRRALRELAEQSRENDRRWAESRAEAAQRAEDVDRRLAEASRQLGRLGNRLGEFVEGVVRPGLVRLFRERGIDVRRTLRDVAGDKNGIALQVDLLVVNDADAVAVEVKSKLTDRDVDDHLERIGKFKTLFPEFASKRLLGAIAAMVVPDDAVRYAERYGLYVIGQRGDDAAFLNSEGFEPRAW